MVDDRLEVMLTEYKSLRDEIKNKFDLQIKLYGIFVSALGVAYGLIFNFGASGDLVLFIPFISIALILRVQHSNYGVEIIGEYLNDKLEPQIKKFMKGVEWEGWQTFWYRRHCQEVVNYNDRNAKWLLFVVIPMVIAIGYSLVNFLKIAFLQDFISFIHKYLPWIKSECQIQSCISPEIHFFLVIGYLSLGVYGMRKVQKLKELDKEQKRKYLEKYGKKES